MATRKAASPTLPLPPPRAISFDEFVQTAVKAAAQATKALPGGPHPIWIGIIIRPPDIAQIIGHDDASGKA